jgi:hypothetical protein
MGGAASPNSEDDADDVLGIVAAPSGRGCRSSAGGRAPICEDDADDVLGLVLSFGGGLCPGWAGLCLRIG